jgi:DNA-binding CsgD family transcriptional regulator
VLGEYRRLSDRRGPDPNTPHLTERETEVLKMVAKGLSYKQIAERLVLSHRTVQNHVQNTLRKLQLHNRVELTRYAIEQGLDVSLLEEADALYGESLSAFTRARDDRAKALKPEDRELSEQVKALRKPSLAAWVLNLLVRREPDQVAQLVNVGAALRDAAASLDAAQLRTLTAQRRQLTAAVTTVSRRHALSEGQKVTESVASEIEETLTAAMVDGGAAEALQSGLLVRPFSTTGIDELDVAPYVAVPEAIGHVASSVPVTCRRDSLARSGGRAARSRAARRSRSRAARRRCRARRGTPPPARSSRRSSAARHRYADLVGLQLAEQVVGRRAAVDLAASRA